MLIVRAEGDRKQEENGRLSAGVQPHGEDVREGALGIYGAPAGLWLHYQKL